MGSAESKSKAVGGTVGGATTAATIGAGIALSIFGGPLGIMYGGVLLGAGVSSAANTVEQCATEGNFDYGKWGTSILDGAVACTPSAGDAAVNIADSHDT